MQQRWMVLVLLTLVLAPLGCGASSVTENFGGREGDREKRNTAERQTPLGRASFVVGFGEGSLWLTDYGDYACDDTPGMASAGTRLWELVSCVAPEETFLRRVDPGSGEVAATARFKGAEVMGVAFGADTVWLSLYGHAPDGNGAVARLDATTSKVTDKIPVESPSGVDFGSGSLWAASETGTVSRIDPERGEVRTRVRVSAGGANDVAVDEQSGAVWVATTGSPESGAGLSPEDFERGTRPEPRKDFKLVRIDLATNRVVAEIPIEENAIEGGASSVAIGGGVVWVTSVNGRLLRVDPETNSIVAEIPIGDYSFDVEASEGAVWATSEVNVHDYAAFTHRITRVDPANNRIIESVDVKDVSGLALSGGEAWATTADTETGEGSLISLTP